MKNTLTGRIPRSAKIILTIIVYAVLILLFYQGFRTGAIKDFISESKFFAPIIYIFITSLKAIFPVVPGEVLVAMGAYLFGPIVGLVYAVIGLTLGSSTAFLLAKTYGRPFVKDLIGEERFVRTDKLSGDKSLFTFFLIYLTPGTPDDFVTYIAGLANLPFRWFLAICILGRLPSYIIYVVGGYSLATFNIKLLLTLWGAMFVVVGVFLVIKFSIDLNEKRKKHLKKRV